MGAVHGTFSLHPSCRLNVASGKADFSAENDNEFVNPRQSLWKWKTAEDFAKEVKGRPLCD